MDRRIRRYIRAKQKLIKLLEELKQVIIHEAVTGQIDVRTGKPYPAYKDSGVEWLGQVPEHWEVRRLKQAFRRVVGGSTPASGNTPFWDGDIVWVTPADVSKTDRLKDSQRHITTEGLASCSAELVPPGSIIVTSRAPVGNVALAQVQLCTNQGCKALVPSGSVIDSLFALALLKTAEAELQSLAVGTTFTEISTGRLGIVRIPLPPLSEQAAIVRYLDEATASTDSAIAHARREIELLREYRTRLIADVVTGKLDVREAAASLPDEAEGPELLAEEDMLTDESEAGESAEDEAALEDLEEVEA
jgi:type I restriction enzyme S subunit